MHTLPAQSPPATAPASGTEFSCVSWEKLPFSEIFYRAGNDYLPLQMRVNKRSKLYTLDGVPAKLELYIKGLSPEGETIYKMIGQAPMLPRTDRMLFFMQPSEDDSGLPVAMYGIDDSLEVFPVGSFRFVNTTQVPLQVIFRDTKEELPARGMKILTPEVPKRSGFIPCYVTDMQKNIVYETRLYAQSRGRKMVFIRAPAELGERVQVRFLGDIVPSPTPPKTDLP